MSRARTATWPALFLTTGDDDRARRHAAEAWEVRHDAPAYVLARTLWLQTLFALIDGTDGRASLGRLKALELDHSDTSPWSMEPTLEALRRRLPDETFAMMMMLYRVVSGEQDRTSLDGCGWWTDVEPDRAA